jgi:hypothetical protein
MIDRWLKAVDKGELIEAEFLDLAKAFDLLDHELLLQKLTAFNHLSIINVKAVWQE